LGRDHFLFDDDIEIRTVALASTVIDWLERDELRWRKASASSNEASE